jgi:hypothetical protein
MKRKTGKSEKPSAAEIEAEIKVAREVLREAEQNFNHRLYRAAISRAYYAMFHAARAALWSRGVTPKTHRGLIQLFGLHIVKRGLAQKEYSDMLTHAHDERELADYHALSGDFQPAGVKQLVSHARRFLKKMEALLKSSSSRG